MTEDISTHEQKLQLLYGDPTTHDQLLSDPRYAEELQKSYAQVRETLETLSREIGLENIVFVAGGNSGVFAERLLEETLAVYPDDSPFKKLYEERLRLNSAENKGLYGANRNLLKKVIASSQMDKTKTYFIFDDRANSGHKALHTIHNLESEGISSEFIVFSGPSRDFLKNRETKKLYPPNYYAYLPHYHTGSTDEYLGMKIAGISVRLSESAQSQ